MSPAIASLLAIMLAFNIFVIISDANDKDELAIVNKIIALYGPSFDNQTLEKMDGDLNKTAEKLGGRNVKQYFDELTVKQYEKSSSRRKQQIEELKLFYIYVEAAKDLSAKYIQINIPKMKEKFIKQQKMPPWLEQKMAGEFDRWNDRYHDIISTNEYRQWSFLNTYRMHSYLFNTTIKKITIEAILLITLLTTLITNYEFERKTQQLIYSSKKGRQLVWQKGFASLLGSLILLLILFGVTLGVYFTINDYSAVWHVPVSSVFNWETNLPYITWWKLPLWKYLLLVLLILTVVLGIISLLTFIISIFVRNTYFIWTLTLTLLVAMFVIPLYFSNAVVLWLMNFNIILLVLNPAIYFNGGDSFMMTQYHELYTILIGSILVIGSSLLAILYFNKKDVH